MKIVKRSLALLLACCIPVGIALAQTDSNSGVKDDIKSAGSHTKKAAKKTARATKKGTKKVTHKAAHKTKQGADKVEDKTQ